MYLREYKSDRTAGEAEDEVACHLTAAAKGARRRRRERRKKKTRAKKKGSRAHLPPSARLVPFRTGPAQSWRARAALAATGVAFAR